MTERHAQCGRRGVSFLGWFGVTVDFFVRQKHWSLLARYLAQPRSVSLSLSLSVNKIMSSKVQKIMVQPIVCSPVKALLEVLLTIPFLEPDLQVSAKCTLAVGRVYFFFFFFLFEDWHLFPFSSLVQKARVQIWLFDKTDMRIEGRIIVSVASVCCRKDPSMLTGMKP